MAPKAIKRGARLDMGFACNLGGREIRSYHDELRALGKNPAAYSVVNSRQVYIADTEEEAWRDIEPHLRYQIGLYGKWLREGSIDTSGQIGGNLDALRKNAVLGPPDHAIDMLKGIIANVPMTELALSTQLPGLDPKKAMRSLHRFTAEVLPALR
jgi:alkanesulfonate monooxygenase SsuD/methylene tetrahydromethanopterin reductase-like flavin-dependent oxidoreductase (luciferase family)